MRNEHALLGFLSPAVTRSTRVVAFLALLSICFTGCGGDGKKGPTTPPQSPVVRLLAPNGGESLLASSQAEISWTASDGDTPSANLRVAIDFTPDGGTIWLTVAPEEQNDGTFTWAVPGLATAQARIRLTVSDGSNVSTDTSDNPFTIVTTPPQPHNTISIGNGSAAPGADVEVPFSLDNEDTAGLVEARIWFDPAVADFQSVRLVERGTGLQMVTLESAEDTVVVTLQQRAGVVVAPGSGPLAWLTFHLTGAGGVQTALRLRRARFLDAGGAAQAVQTSDGSLTVLMVDTPETLTNAGWEAFETNNLTLAIEKFDAAIGLDAAYGPAYAGRGWVRLTRATTADAYRLAVTAFDEAVGRGQTGADVRGGRAAARLALGGSDLDAAVADANAALQDSADFVFAHRTSFDYRDLRLIVAFAEAGRGDRFTEARQAADLVADSGIRLGNEESWIVDEVRYPTFESAVLAWLHRLSATYSG